MNILCLVQSFIPGERHAEYLRVVRRTIEILRQQSLSFEDRLTIVLTDDGSCYLDPFTSGQIKHFSSSEIEEVKRKYKLDVDYIVACPSSNYFMKASLFNVALESYGSDNDLIIYLDDDQHLLSAESVSLFRKRCIDEYNFIVRRLAQKNGHLFKYTNDYVQGTTFATTYNLIRDVGFFNEQVKSWGLGDDEDLFWRIYCKYREKE